MSIFEGEFFKLGDKQTAPADQRAATPDEIARGDYWSLYLRGGRHVLAFISGELAGREKQIEISPEEADAIVAGTTSVEAVLIAHGAG